MDEATLFEVPPKGKKFFSKGAWYGSPDRFPRWARSLNFANASTMASATPGVKNTPETSVVSVTWPLFKF